MFTAAFAERLSDLRNAKNSDEFLLVFEGFLKNHGFWSFNYGYLDTLNFDVSEAPVSFISTMDEGWLSHYAAQRYDLIDPGVENVKSSSAKPILFDTDIDGDSRTSKRSDLHFLDEARDAGLTSSASIPLPALRQGPEILSGIGLISDMKTHEFAKLWRESHAEILVFTYMFHEKMSGEISRRYHGVPELTDREKDCLAAIAKGERPDRIADRLSIATVTVNYHIQQIRKKLGARTNAEAVARAVSYGQL
ncbi:MAG: hypothetical protein CMK07_10550 [Ponticaulis sp.]|nr:hypothetical protein [Ponticaulis sp.]